MRSHIPVVWAFVFLAAFSPLLTSRVQAAQREELRKLDGTWLFVKDQTEGRALEMGGAPMSVQFVLRVEEDAVIYPRPSGDERITIDGSAIERKADDGSITRYRGQWTEGSLEYTLEKTRPGDDEPVLTLKRIFRPTDDGLLVYVVSGSSKQVALYRHPEDIPLPEPAMATITDMAWLAGIWAGMQSTSSIEERWIPMKGGAMLGISRTIRGERMTAFEYLRIVERDGGLIYIAQPGGRPPTEFVLTELNNQRAVFLNPRHDYPQRIVYELTDSGVLSASVGFAIGRLQRLELTSETDQPSNSTPRTP